MAKHTKHDETIPGGTYIRDGFIGDDDRHYGGEVVNAEGVVLATFADKEINDGKPKPVKDKTHDDKPASK